MSVEKDAEKTIELYKQLAKDDKNVDAGALVTAMLEQTRRSEVDAKKKRMAYLVSVGLPPFGLIFAFIYYFGEKSDGKRVALTCVILTAVSLLGSWLLFKMFMDSLGPQMQQIQAMNASELQGLLQQ